MGAGWKTYERAEGDEFGPDGEVGFGKFAGFGYAWHAEVIFVEVVMSLSFCERLVTYSFQLFSIKWKWKCQPSLSARWKNWDDF